MKQFTFIESASTLARLTSATISSSLTDMTSSSVGCTDVVFRRDITNNIRKVLTDRRVEHSLDLTLYST